MKLQGLRQIDQNISPGTFSIPRIRDLDECVCRWSATQIVWSVWRSKLSVFNEEWRLHRFNVRIIGTKNYKGKKSSHRNVEQSSPSNVIRLPFPSKTNDRRDAKWVYHRIGDGILLVVPNYRHEIVPSVRTCDQIAPFRLLFRKEYEFPVLLPTVW